MSSLVLELGGLLFSVAAGTAAVIPGLQGAAGILGLGALALGLGAAAAGPCPAEAIFFEYTLAR